MKTLLPLLHYRSSTAGFRNKARLSILLLITSYFLSSTEIFAQPVWQSATSGTGSGGTVAVNKPANTVEGDLLIAGFMYESGTGATLTVPSGWTLIRRTDQSSNVGMATYYKRATASEPASYSWGTGGKYSVGISRITGANGIYLSADSSASTAGTAVGAPALATNSNVLVLAFYTIKNASTFTAVSGTTERYDVPNTSGGIPGNMLATYVQTTPGNTGAKTATASASETWASQQIGVSSFATYNTAGNFTFTPPAGVTAVNVLLWGGGGGGGFATGNNGAAGGGGGAFTEQDNVAVSTSSTYAIVVGAGGAGATTTSASNGEQSTFNTTILARGGSGGASSGSAGAGGTISSLSNTLNRAGGAGGNGSASSNTGGGGGGASGNPRATGTAGSASVAAGGAGGTGISGGGSGGNGGASSGAVGSPGSVPGGGGGGEGRSANNGGNGANGQVQVFFSCPTYSLTSTTLSGSVCSGNTASISLSAAASSLPVGTYTITYSISGANTASNQTATMTVTNAGSGSFSTGALNSSGSTTITITQLQSGGSSGCTSAISANNTATFSVAATPTASISGTATGCGSVTLTASGGGTYQWSGGSATTSASNTFSTSATYTVTVTSASGCTATASSAVTVNTIPTATISGSTTGCGSVSLTASGGTTYAWSGGSATTSAVNTFTSSGTYTVTATSAAGCTDTETASVTINTAPTASISGTSTGCSIVTLTASGGDSYDWDGGGNPTSAQNTFTISGTYTVTVTAANGCTATASQAVTVNSGGTVFTSATSSSICENGGVTLSAAGYVNTGSAGDFTFAASSGTFTALTGATVVSKLAGDDSVSAAIPLGFTFNAFGSSYTQIYASSNGFLSFNSALAGLGGANTATYTNSINAPNTSVIPLLAPLWDDLSGVGGTASYKTTGTAGDRVFHFEWLNWRWSYTATSPVISFQVKIYEQSGKIEFVYRPETAAIAGTATASIGLAGPSVGNYESVSSAASNATSSTTTAQNGINAKPANGQTFTFSSPAISGYTWSPSTFLSATTGASVSASNMTTSTTYTATQTGGSGCAGSSVITVTVDPLPVVSITGNNTICSGLSTTLTASGATSYSWNSGSTAASITVSPNVATTYTVTGTDGNGCTSTATRAVTINALPAISISGTNTICNGSSTTLTASGASSYVWNNGATTAAITVSPSSATTYTVTGTDGNGCTSTATRAVTVNSLPTVSVSGTNTICNGSSTTLTASGASSYVWNTTATTAAITVTPSSATTYTVTGTDANGCTATATRSVAVNTLPTVSISGTNTICNGTSTTLTASGASSYTWNTGATTPAITVSPSSATTYTITGTDANGCTSTATRAVAVNTLPTAGITNNTGVTILTCSTTAINVTASGGTAYSWNGGLGTSTSVSIMSPGTYTVTVTDANSCSATASITITQNITAPAAPTATNAARCSTGTVTISATPASGSTIDWYSAAAGGSVLSGGTGVTTFTTPDISATTIYYAETRNTTNGCVSSTRTAVTATINAYPVPTFTTSAPVSSVNTNATYTTQSGNTAYSWTLNGTVGVDYTVVSGGGSSNNSITVQWLKAGYYTISVSYTDANGCAASSPVSTNTFADDGKRYSVATGNWSSTSTWAVTSGGTSGAPVPSATNQVFVEGGYTVTLTSNTTANGAMTVRAGSTLALSTFTLGAPASLSMECGASGTAAIITGSGLLTLGGNVSVTSINAGSVGAVISCPVDLGASRTFTVADDGSTAVDITLSGIINSASADLTKAGAGKLSLGSVNSNLNSLLINTGVLVSTSGKLCLSGDFTEGANGIFLHNNGTICFAKPTSTQTITGVDNFYNLHLGKSAGSVAMGNDVTIDNNLVFENGNTATLTSGNFNVIVTNAAVNAVSRQTSASGFVIGNLRRNIAAGSNSYFFPVGTAADYVPATLDFTGLSTGGFVTLRTDTSRGANYPNNLSNTKFLSRYWTVTNGGIGTFTADVTCSYVSGELRGGAQQGNLKGYKHSSGSTTYPTLSFPSANSVRFSGITSFSEFGLGECAGASLSGTVTNVGCFGASTGAVNITVSGATTPITYSWSGPSSYTSASEDISGLSPGTYTVSVSDAATCTASGSYSVTQPASALSASISSTTNVSCFGGSNGAATVSASGGTTAYAYSWTGGGSTTSISGKAAGSYTVTVTDANSCTTSATATITEPAAALSASISSTTNVSCFGGNNGAATVSASGGTTAYNYSWTGGGTTTSISSKTAGSYTVTVTDANSCTVTATATITQPATALSVSTSQTDVLCNGAPTGSASATPSGGTTGYTYSWTNGSTASSLSNIKAGAYTVTVTDANSCTTSSTVTITQPATALSVSVTPTHLTCNGISNGSATATPAGGTPTYTYSWTGGGTTSAISAKAAGDYLVTVTDGNGCQTTAIASIAQPAPISVTSSRGASFCASDPTPVSFNVTGGTAPYSTSGSFGNGGVYTVTVTDNNGCTKTETIQQ